MKFSLFYEIPVPKPWDQRSEYRAFKEVIEQAILADAMGFHAVWSVEHHFLEEFSHCSNPEVLYGAIAARTTNLRIGYGVRLAPKPYNHPVRSAESAAMLDQISDGRVYFGTGRSATRAELEGFGIDPQETRDMWLEAVEHIVGCWTNEVHEFDGKFWQMPKRMVVPKPLQQPHPPMFGATGSIDGHEMMGELGLGLCSFSIGTSMEHLADRVDRYRAGFRRCTDPIAAFKNEHVVAFTMVNCADRAEDSYDAARHSYEWYARASADSISELSDWVEERSGNLGTFNYTDKIRAATRKGSKEVSLNFDAMMAKNSVIAGDPDEVIRRARQYEEAGVDQLLCLMNPHNIPHDKVLRTIELLGKYVLPEFEDSPRGAVEAVKA
jgi:alkanesulfonate monooxygenase SsuD/methylene tetrahydromethanopterin reductase-like flavin-dependent oxidoreductase (luciferase family)